MQVVNFIGAAIDYIFGSAPTQKEVELEAILPFTAERWKEVGLREKVIAPEIPEKIQTFLKNKCSIWPDKLAGETHFVFPVSLGQKRFCRRIAINSRSSSSDVRALTRITIRSQQLQPQSSERTRQR